MSLSIKEKLKHLHGFSPPDPNPARTPCFSREEQFDAIGGKVLRTDIGSVVIRENSFPLNFRHGPNRLDELLELNPNYFAYIGKDAALSNLDIRKAVFIDTETTGLAGGAGTYAFLIGIGYFTQHSFFVKQFFMPDYQHEPAVLSLLEKKLHEYSAFISYNGKSYDIPALKSRFVLNRLPTRYAAYLHLDLLHAARRLWKKNIGECSLQNIERHILGFQRHDDIPGYAIPQKYFNYLYSRDVNSLLPIFKHNAMDILSLISITLSAGKAFDKCEYPSDSLAVMKVLYHLNEFEKAGQFLNNLNSQMNESLCALYQARLLKKMSLTEQAEKQWLWLIDQSQNFHVEPYIELAKLYEHNHGNACKALDIINRLEKRLKIRQELFSSNESELFNDDIAHRKKRLNRKLRNAEKAGGRDTKKCHETT